MQMSFRFSLQRKSQQNADRRLPWRCVPNITQKLRENIGVKGFKSTVLKNGFQHFCSAVGFHPNPT